MPAGIYTSEVFTLLTVGYVTPVPTLFNLPCVLSEEDVSYPRKKLYSRVSQPGFREMSLGVPREIVIEKK
jgi:hypothetical protein